MDNAEPWVDTAAVRRATRLEEHRSARREKIIKAAAAAIEKHGPDALTGQIAEHAGLARPHVYRHFDSKGDLDRAVARHANRELTSRIRASLSRSATLIELLGAPLAEIVQWAEANPNLYRFLLRHPPSTGDYPRVGGAFAMEISAWAGRVLARFGGDPAAVDNVLPGVVGLIDASVTWWLDHPANVSRAELTERLTTQAWLLFDQMQRDIGLDLDPSTPIDPLPDAPLDR